MMPFIYPCYLATHRDMHRPVRLEHVPEFDQAILRDFNQLVLSVGVLSVSISFRHLEIRLFNGPLIVFLLIDLRACVSLQLSITSDDLLACEVVINIVFYRLTSDC